MTVYIVLSKQEESYVEAVFANRNRAEDYMIKEATKEMDYFDVRNENRHCIYRGKELEQIYDDESYTCDWWIVARTLEED